MGSFDPLLRKFQKKSSVKETENRLVLKSVDLGGNYNPHFEDIEHLPNPFAFPWMYGLRSEEGLGGNDDYDVFEVYPQGSVRPPVIEAEIGDRNRAAEWNDEPTRKILRQIARVRARYYDSRELLEAYGVLMQNQLRVTQAYSEGKAQPIQVIRGREREMPLPLPAWKEDNEV